MTAVTTQPPKTLTFQGIVVPGSSLNPTAFFAGTRRQTVLQRTISSWASWGNTDVVDTLRSGILAGYFVKIAGTLVVTLHSTGTVATTAAWPYGLLRAVRFQANGQSNLINASGSTLRAREFIANPQMSDRGVANGVGGASPGTSRTQGTLALNSESWGVGSNVTAIPGGTYDVELSIYVPVAYEKKYLVGAVFCQTLSTTLELALTWAPVATLFTIVSPATVTFTPTVAVEAEMFTIPSDGKGGFFLPTLSAFHSLVEQKAFGNVTSGVNEIQLSGQGVGRSLLRVIWRVLNGATRTPVVPTAANFTSPYWRYGTNVTPETWVDGRDLRYSNERSYDTDIAALYGYSVIDFDKTWAFRDAVTEGSATELRFGFTAGSGWTPTGAICNYAQDVILAGAAA